MMTRYIALTGDAQGFCLQVGTLALCVFVDMQGKTARFLLLAIVMVFGSGKTIACSEEVWYKRKGFWGKVWSIW